MPLLVVFDVDGMTAAQYDAVIGALGDAGQSAPQGRLTHVAAARPGGWLVVDTYESEEAFARFGQQLMPILGAAGINPEPRVYAAHSLVINGTGVPA